MKACTKVSAASEAIAQVTQSSACATVDMDVRRKERTVSDRTLGISRS